MNPIIESRVTPYAGLDYITRVGSGLHGTSFTIEKNETTLRVALAITRELETYTGFSFYPLLATVTENWHGDRKVYPKLPFTEITALSDYVNSVEISKLILQPQNALLTRKPYRYIQAKDTAVLFSYQDTIYDAITITGKWGYYHNDFDTTLDLTGELEQTATTVNLTGHGLEVGTMLRIGSEYMTIYETDTDTFKVVRGMNGSTAATHAIGADIFIISPIQELKHACAVLTARALARGQSGWSDMAGSAVEGFMYLKDMPIELKSTLHTLRNYFVRPRR